tara:strand:+ start:63 stop:806 length:744 start_codon:yes stop_codon:yes gene_type:complete
MKLKMKFKFLLFLFLTSCATELNKNYEKNSYSSSGLAYIYSEQDFNDKIIKKRFDNTKLLVAHSKLKTGTLVKLTNPNNNKSINVKIYKKINYPELYQILITETVAEKLNLKKEVPYIEIEEIKKNKSFIADRAKTFKEEKKVHNKAPIENVKIDNISKKKKNTNKQINNFSIIIAQFYSKESAILLKNRLTQELTSLDDKKMSIKSKGKNEFELFMGPYSAVNLLKNDYIILKRHGFEELDIKLNE